MYHKTFIDRSTCQTKNMDNLPESSTNIVLPYVQGQPEAVQRLLKPLGITSVLAHQDFAIGGYM